MAGHARQVAALRPAAVSIHNDCDVLRQAVRVQVQEEPFFSRLAGWSNSRSFTRLFPRIPLKSPEAVSRACWKANIGHLRRNTTPLPSRQIRGSPQKMLRTPGGAGWMMVT